MKIICLIRRQPALVYFVNKIHESHPVSLVIVEDNPVSRKFTDKVKQAGAKGVASAIKSKVENLSRRKEYQDDYEKFFCGKWLDIDTDIPSMTVKDINEAVVSEKLRDEHPDLLLDHGTSLVKDHVLSNAELALNLHWGLSPWYRGSHCTQWALINRDTCNIGATVHKLTKEIDGGSILGQRRADISADDTVHSINMQLTCLGTEIILEAVKTMEAGEELVFHEQDLSLGIFKRIRDWTPEAEEAIKEIERKGFQAIFDEQSEEKQRRIIEL